jgi:2-polyprenyl-6-hydroxyphenyl methylase/3-demethylubiquinone-9 3-methyltransferase
MNPENEARVEGISYEYTEARPDGSHDYLMPVIWPMLQALPPGSSVLDMGCGNGSFLARLPVMGWRLIGTDLSPSGIEIARRTHPEIEFFMADAQTDLTQQVGPMDAVISTEVIEHLYDPQSFLRNAYTLLKPEGILILTTPYHGYLKNLMLALTGEMDRHFTVLWDHGHIKFWSRKTLTEALTKTGFRVETFVGAGRIPFLWKSMVMKAVK